MTQPTHVRETEQDFTSGQPFLFRRHEIANALPPLVIAATLVYLSVYITMTVRDLTPILQQAVEDVRQGRQEVQRIREALGPFVPTDRPR